MRTILWYDYEAFSPNAREARTAQFACQRTDADLVPVGDPVDLLCRPGYDHLPSPGACLIHGLTPQRCEAEGLPEHLFARRVHEILAEPDTCAVGYNAEAFDHQVSRFLFFRNLMDPYGWHWQNGNARADAINLVRAAYATSQPGLGWHFKETGSPSFKLTDVAGANGIEFDAHEALEDVQALIAVGRRIRSSNDRLFDYFLKLSDKYEVQRVVEKAWGGALLHISRYQPSRFGHASVVTPLAEHPQERGTIITFDLRADPREWARREVGELRRLLFARVEDLTGNEERPPLGRIRYNTAPFVAPASTLGEAGQRRIGLPRATWERHLSAFRDDPGLGSRLAEAFFDATTVPREPVPEEEALYDGFIPDDDRRHMDELLALSEEEAAREHPKFRDPRLGPLFEHYLGRNCYEVLDSTRQAAWRDHCRARWAAQQASFDAELAQVTSAPMDKRTEEMIRAVREWIDHLHRWAD